MGHHHGRYSDFGDGVKFAAFEHAIECGDLTAIPSILKMSSHERTLHINAWWKLAIVREPYLKDLLRPDFHLTVTALSRDAMPSWRNELQTAELRTGERERERWGRERERLALRGALKKIFDERQARRAREPRMPTVLDEPRLLTKHQVSKFLGVWTGETILAKAKARERGFPAPVYDHIGRACWLLADIEKWIRDNSSYISWIRGEKPRVRLRADGTVIYGGADPSICQAVAKLNEAHQRNQHLNSLLSPISDKFGEAERTSATPVAERVAEYRITRKQEHRARAAELGIVL